jgi:hypothetical protein
MYVLLLKGEQDLFLFLEGKIKIGLKRTQTTSTWSSIARILFIDDASSCHLLSRLYGDQNTKIAFIYHENEEHHLTGRLRIRVPKEGLPRHYWLRCGLLDSHRLLQVPSYLYLSLCDGVDWLA